MTAPGEYARRVRQRPYGPEEFTRGGITAWFHGPFTVLTLTDANGSSVTISGAADDSPIGLRLADLFTAAISGREHEFTAPELLAVEGGTASVRRLAVRPSGEGTVLIAETTGQAVEVILSDPDVRELAKQTQKWALRVHQ